MATLLLFGCSIQQNKETYSFCNYGFNSIRRMKIDQLEEKSEPLPER